MVTKQLSALTKLISVLESDISSPVLGPAEVPYIPEQVYPLQFEKQIFVHGTTTKTKLASTNLDTCLSDY